MKLYLRAAYGILLVCSFRSSTLLHAQTGNVGIGITNPQSKLHTTGSVRHDTLAGVGSRLVFADSLGRLSAACNALTNITSSAIPDYLCAGVNSTITVSGMPTAVPSANIKVRIDISHMAVHDLRIFLIAPGGGTLNLAYNDGGSGQSFTNTIFWDGAAQNLSAGSPPFTGTYKPSGLPSSGCGFPSPIATFGGFGNGTIVPDGVWTLRVFDATAGSTGTLNNWSISFDGSDPLLPVRLFTNNRVPKGSGGTLVDGSIYDINGKIGIGTTAPQSMLHTTGSVRHDTLAGAGPRMVFADPAGRLFTAGAPTNLTSAAIPDYSCTGVSSTIAISGMPNAVLSGNIKVRVDISHNSVHDLAIFLIAPNGGTVNLTLNHGGTGDNFTNTIFWDGAAQNISTGSPPFTGTYKPYGYSYTACGLSSTVTTFGGLGNGTIVPDGVWTLHVRDANDASVAGTLNNWSISFDGSDPLLSGSPITNNRVPKGSGGTLADGSIYDVAGNIGIGTAAPLSRLTLDGGGGDAFTILNGGDVRIFNDNGTGSALLYASGGIGANNAIFSMLSDGKVYNFNGTGGSVSSDRRLKQDIIPLERSLGKVMQLNGYTYRFKSKAHVAQKEVGVIAQEVQAVLPEAVTENADGTLAVSYNALVPLLINAVKEQQKEIDELQKKEATYAELAAQLKEVQQMLGVKPKTTGSKVGSR